MSVSKDSNEVKTIGPNDRVSGELTRLGHMSLHSAIMLRQVLRLGVLASFALIIQAKAQFYQPITIDASLLKFFGENTAFAAKAEFITQTDGKQDVMPVKIAILGKMARVEMDITQQNGGKASDEVMTGYYNDLKTAGSAEAVSIFNPTQKSTYIILPRLKVYLQTPIPAEQLEQLKERPKSDTTELGKDKIGGRECTKYKVIFSAERPMDAWRTWETPSAIVWMAQGSPVSPLHLDVLGSDGRTNCVLEIGDVQPGKVDAKLFEPPHGFKKCASQDALMQVIMEHWPKEKSQ